MHVSFQQHHARSHFDLDIQPNHHVDEVFQNQPFVQLITCEHSFDGQYQRPQHPLVNQKFCVWQ